MKQFADKVVVITGAGSGIGRALSLEFARRGARVALSDVNAANAEETAKLAGDNAARRTTSTSPTAPPCSRTPRRSPTSSAASTSS